MKELLPQFHDIEVIWRPCEAHPRPERYGLHSDLCIQGLFFAMEQGADIWEYHDRRDGVIATRCITMRYGDTNRGVFESIMNTDILMFFDKMPDMLPLYETIENKICTEFEGVRIKVSKTQISFSNKYGFAYISLPVRKKKEWPKKCLVLTFGLSRQVIHPRIAISTEPYPQRWTHHVIIQSTDDVDEQLMEWINEAYGFSMVK